jgi:hypothetical protein
MLMTDRAGCVSGKREYGSRKFGEVKYDVYKVYVTPQDFGFSSEKRDIRIAENSDRMEHDRKQLKEKGIKTRLRREECGQILILYYRGDV